MTALDAAQERFLAEARRAVLATIDPDGRPRLVPICHVLLGTSGDTTLYSPLDEKPKRAADPHALGRVRDLLARPDVSVLVDRWDEDWTRLAWLRVDGTARLLEPGDGAVAMERAAVIVALRAKYRQYADHDLEANPMIRIVLERVTAWGSLDTARSGPGS